MAKASVAAEMQGRVDPEGIASLLRAAGATDVTVDRRSGDPYLGIEGYFFIEFDDDQGFVGRRHAYGFHAYAFQAEGAEEVEMDGTTRVQLGADDRGRMFMEAVAEGLRGRLVDGRTDESVDFSAPEPALAP